MLITVSFAVLFLICAFVCIYLFLTDKKNYPPFLWAATFICLVICGGILASLREYSGGRPMDYKDLDTGRYKLFSAYQGPSDNGYITVLIQKEGEKVVRSAVFKKEDWRVERNDGYITVEERTINSGSEKQEKIAY